MTDDGKPWKPDLYVVARLLDALWQPDRTHTRSSLQRATRLNYDLFRRYLGDLEARGLVAIDAEAIRITAAGLDLHRRLQAWLADFFAPDRL